MPLLFLTMLGLLREWRPFIAIGFYELFVVFKRFLLFLCELHYLLHFILPQPSTHLTPLDVIAAPNSLSTQQ